MAVDEAKVGDLLGRFVTDFGAAFHAVNAVIGDRLGLYAGLEQVGPATPAELAAATGTAERYVREWLNGQAAGGYITYDAASGSYSLTEEQVFVLSAAGMSIPSAFRLPVAVAQSVDRLTEVVRTGIGFGWHEHDAGLFEGTERFFRPGYVANLASSWIPALDGVEDKLRRGAKVADVGCGHGASTVLLAQAYPDSTITGFDYHAPSIDVARKRAAEAGVADRATFEVASAADFEGSSYDLVAIFDALHDMPDPLSAAKHIRAALADDGTFLLVEPYAEDNVEDNLNPVGRVFYNASTVICVAHSMTEDPKTALGAQAGEASLIELLREAGFTRIRRATETPFNLVIEARP
jgi:ubiquinone/menaquinone biosynthesis C-methylase UbiE